jgi:hypothetical protein
MQSTSYRSPVALSASRCTIRSITWPVPSSKHRDNGITYTVSESPVDGRLDCDCPARGDCWHQKSVRSGQAGKPRVRVTLAPRPAPATVPTFTPPAADDMLGNLMLAEA